MSREVGKMPNIRIDREVYRRLQQLAEPFVDTPNNVLRRVFGLDRDESRADGRAVSEKVSTEPTDEELLELYERGTQGGESKLKSSQAKLVASGTRSDRSKAVQRGRLGKRRRTPRAPAGTLLPEQEYVVPVLAALAERGGTAPAREIIEAVGKKLESRLTPTDKETNSSGVIRWQNRIQFVRLKLVEENLLAKGTPRGIWALTEPGRSRLDHSHEVSRVG
jgi:hypothetical protein